jgi:hypothetical protein
MPSRAKSGANACRLLHHRCDTSLLPATAEASFSFRHPITGE